MDDVRCGLDHRVAVGKTTRHVLNDATPTRRSRASQFPSTGDNAWTLGDFQISLFVGTRFLARGRRMKRPEGRRGMESRWFGIERVCRCRFTISRTRCIRRGDLIEVRLSRWRRYQVTDGAQSLWRGRVCRLIE